jgi:hypothetical protein
VLDAVELEQPTGNYATAVAAYEAAGWQGVLPLPPGAKTPPPRGYTGADGRWPSEADKWDWRLNWPPDCNVALRLPASVIGLDIDQYDNKQGWDRLLDAAREHRLAPLPPTWRSSARPGPSGIYLYGVPEGTRLRGEAVPDVETIQHGHRFAIVWPSVHPALKAPYTWWPARGVPVLNGEGPSVPHVTSLPALPGSWLDFLADTAAVALPADLPAPEAHRETDWHPKVWEQHTMANHQLAETSPGSRHEIARDRAMALCRMEQDGLAGSTAALDELGATFVAIVGPSRGVAEAESEWRRIVEGGRRLARTTVTAVQVAQRDEQEGIRLLVPAPATPAPEEPTEAAREGPKQGGLSFKQGGSWVLDQPEGVPAVWGRGDEVLWAEGEPFLLVAPPGVGKTTVMGQVVRALIGLDDEVLDLPVPGERRVLVIAGDRPRQIARSYRRHYSASDRDLLNDRLVVWEGPPPVDLARHPEMLREMADKARAEVVILDSVKDMAVGLTDDEVGSAYNRAVQLTIAAGVEVGQLHHQRKGQGGAKARTLEDVYGSTWITAGAGSVVLLWGAAGDPLIELVHLKQPAAEVGPLKIEHDHLRGHTFVHEGFDVLRYLRYRGANGATAVETARQMFGSFEPSNNERRKAKRRLEALVERELAIRDDAPKGGAGGSSAARYRAVELVPGSTTTSNDHQRPFDPDDLI